jgi:hypothetical protein
MALACLVSIVLAVLLGAVVNASVSGPVPPEQLFSDSDLVVTGWVIGLNPQWGQGMAGINTIIRFNVDGVAKGELQEGIIEVSIPGGQIGEQGVWVEDQPTFALGEHALLYLLSTGYVSQDGYPRYRLTTGTFMGKSDATGNTTIGVDGKLVPINPLEGLSKGITSVARARFPSRAFIMNNRQNNPLVAVSTPSTDGTSFTVTFKLAT